MSQIDLSSLPGQELRQLLDSARRQGQAAQTYEILREMDARRERGERPRKRWPRRPAAEPRLIVLNLGDPMDAHDDPLEEPADESPPLTLGDPDLRRSTPVPPAPRTQRWAHWAALCFAVGTAAGVAGGWWAARIAPEGRSPPMILAASRPVLARSPLQVVVSEPIAMAAEPAPAADPPPAADSAPPSSFPSPQDLDPPASSPTGEPMQLAIAETSGAAQASTAPVDEKACSAEPTPADRTICEAPRLQRLQIELRQTYAEALRAHQDRSLLRQRQLAWRDARNTVTNSDQLARLYVQRIEKLKAATAEAVRER